MRCARTTGMKGGDADAAVLFIYLFFLPKDSGPTVL